MQRPDMIKVAVLTGAYYHLFFIYTSIYLMPYENGNNNYNADLYRCNSDVLDASLEPLLYGVFTGVLYASLWSLLTGCYSDVRRKLNEV